MLLVAGLQAAQDIDRVLHRGLGDVDLLEAPRERVVLLEDAAIFVVGRRADAAQLAVGERGLDQVGGVHHAARGRAGADHGMDLIDEQNRARLLLHLREHRLQALLEIAAILGAGNERSHVERIDRGIEQHVRHLVLDDHARQALGDRGLADAGFADVQGIVLAPPAQNLDGALHLELAADQRIDLALARGFVEVRRVLLRARCRCRRRRARHRPRLPPSSRSLRSSPPAFERPWAMKLTTSRRDTSCMLSRYAAWRLLFAEDRDQHVGHGDFFLAARLHVEHRALQHPLKAERRLHVTILARRQPRRGLVDELLELRLELGGIRPAGLQDLANLRGVHDREQQVLHRHEFMARLARAGESIVQAKLEFLTKHWLRLF